MTLIELVGVALFGVLGWSAQSHAASSALSARTSLAAGAASSKIAFISEGLGGGYCGVVHVMNPDGSDQRRLTNHGMVPGFPGCRQQTGRAWSPDGRRIAIVSGFSPTAIYVMNVDGRGMRRLAGNVAWRAPAWSPDGRRIAFTDAGIYVVNADGTGQRRLIARDGDGSAWSPDGRRIAFVGSVGRGLHNTEIYVVKADGSGQRRLTHNTVADSNPVWSPDGRKIAFESNWQLWVMNADGSSQRRLTRTGAHNRNPAWSPAGEWIAFERGRRKRSPYYPGSAWHEVHVMNADGSGQHRLTRGGSQPYWSPDGRKVAFVSRRDGDADIHVMNADGSGQRNLTRRTGRRESQPVWSPALK